MMKKFSLVLFFLWALTGLVSCSHHKDEPESLEVELKGCWRAINEADTYRQILYFYFGDNGMMVVAIENVGVDYHDENAVAGTWWVVDNYLFIGTEKYEVMSISDKSLSIRYAGGGYQGQEQLTFTKVSFNEIKPFIDKYL